MCIEFSWEISVSEVFFCITYILRYLYSVSWYWLVGPCLLKGIVGVVLRRFLNFLSWFFYLWGWGCFWRHQKIFLINWLQFRVSKMKKIYNRSYNCLLWLIYILFSFFYTRALYILELVSFWVWMTSKIIRFKFRRV